MRNQIAARRARGHPRGDDQLHQHRAVAADPGPDRGRRGRRAAGQPRAAEQPRLPRPGAAATHRRPRGCSSSTRPTASPTGATTSGPTTAASARSSPSCPTASRCWRPRPPPTRGSPRRGRAAGPFDRLRDRGGARPARFARPRVAASRRGPAPDARAAARLAGRAPRRAPRLRHRLLPHRGGHPRGGGAPARPRPHGRGVLRADRADRATGPRAGPPRRPGQGAGGDERARDGLRRHPRVRDQPGRPAVAGRLLPAGRACRPRHRRGHRGAPAAGRGPRHLALLRLAVLPARGARAPDPRGARRLPDAARARPLSRPTSS